MPSNPSKFALDHIQNKWFHSGAMVIKPNEKKSLELKEILFKKIASRDYYPIKKIESISGNRKVRVVHYDFVPFEFEPEYSFTSSMNPNPAFEGSASKSSFKLRNGKVESALSDDNPKECQATIFIENVVTFIL